MLCTTTVVTARTSPMSIHSPTQEMIITEIKSVNHLSLGTKLFTYLKILTTNRVLNYKLKYIPPVLNIFNSEQQVFYHTRSNSNHNKY